MTSRLRHLSIVCGAILWLGICVDGTQSALRPAAPKNADDVRQTVSDVLSDSEYRHLHEKEDSAREDWVNRDDLPDWLKRFLKWLTEDDSESISPNDALNLGKALYYVALSVLAVLLICLVAFILRWSEEQPDIDASKFSADKEAIIPTQPPGDVPTNEYEQRALAAAQAGDFRSALRELVLGSMSWAERAGLVRYRRGLTNRDYIRAVWRMVERRKSLLLIVSAFERVFYGRRLADEATFEACLVEFRQSFLTEANDAQPSN